MQSRSWCILDQWILVRTVVFVFIQIRDTGLCQRNAWVCQQCLESRINCVSFTTVSITRRKYLKKNCTESCLVVSTSTDSSLAMNSNLYCFWCFGVFLATQKVTWWFAAYCNLLFLHCCALCDVFLEGDKDGMAGWRREEGVIPIAWMISLLSQSFWVVTWMNCE